MNRARTSNRKLILIFLAAAAVLTLAPSIASAATGTFTNGSAITIPSQGQASPAVSPLYVGGLRGPIVDIEVQLNGVTHTRPRDLDVLLVAPDGTRTILMSDACGAADVADKTWIFKSDGFLVPPMFDTVSCPGTYYLPTNYLFPDVWPASPGNSYSLLRSFHRKALDGDWRLLVVDDEAGDSGRIARGWTMRLTTGPVEALIPATGTRGQADRYPATKTLPAATGRVISDVDVTVPGLAHDRPDDLDLLLVGPQGQKTLLMSDACGSTPIESFFTFDDEASGALSDEFDSAVCRSGRVKPASYDPGDSLPAPAPGGPYATSLNELYFTEPGGEWKLYAADDADGREGYLFQPFDLEIKTRAKATVAFGQGAIEVAEGVKQALTLRRTMEGGLGPAAVTVTTTPGSAGADSDFTPVSTRVRFARNQRQETVLLDARADGAAEGAESYTVAIANPAGDAGLGSPAQVQVTIPASGSDADGGPGAAGRCAGKPATIVGTAGRDVLRGSRRADVIVALAGSDKVKGASGNDLICAGAGNDRVAGEAGRDRLLGGAGKDRMSGGAGRDTCVGGKGRDRATCERRSGV